MIDYATWCAISEGVAKHLSAAQLSGALKLDIKTVRHWIGRPYVARRSARRASKLDRFKGRIVGWLDAHPLTGQQVFQRLCETGYTCGVASLRRARCAGAAR